MEPYSLVMNPESTDWERKRRIGEGGGGILADSTR